MLDGSNVLQLALLCRGFIFAWPRRIFSVGTQEYFRGDVAVAVWARIMGFVMICKDY